MEERRKVHHVRAENLQWFIPIASVLWMLCFMTQKPVSADSSVINIPKKIISMGYDDSGSMDDGIQSWAKANYAAQTFAALLNEQDEFYITYMADPYQAVAYDMTDPQDVVESIRSHTNFANNTPIECVETAYNKLMQIKDGDQDTQYWLVVASDGNPTNADGYQKILDQYAGSKMPNGTELQIFFMGIGEAFTDDTVQGNGSNFRSLAAGQNIVPTMADIADQISGRMRFDNPVVQGDTVKVHSDIPIYTISVLSQKTQAEVLEASAEQVLIVERNIPVRYPDPDYAATDTSLFGNTSFITNGTDLIPSGDYIITFSENVASDNLVIMYQPAIDWQLIVKQNGKEITDYSAMETESDIHVEIVAYDPIDHTVIDPAVLPGSIRYSLKHEIDGTKISSEKKNTLDTTVHEKHNVLTGTVKIDKYVPTVIKKEFEIYPYEPTPGIHLVIRYNGEVYYDNAKPQKNKLNRLEQDDQIDIEATVLDLKTGDLASADALDNVKYTGKTFWITEYTVDSVSIRKEDRNEILDLQLETGKNQIDCTYSDEKGRNITESVEFEIAPKMVFGMEAEGNKAVFDRCELLPHSTEEDGAILWITGDGNHLDKEQCKGKEALVLSVTTEKPEKAVWIKDFFFREAEVKVAQNADGSFYVFPVKDGKFPAFHIKSGTYTVKVVLSSDGSIKTEVTFEIITCWKDWIPLLITLLLGLTIWYISYLLFMKEKFSGEDDLVVEVFKTNHSGGGIRMKSSSTPITLNKYGQHGWMIRPATVKSTVPIAFTVVADATGSPVLERKSLGSVWGSSELNPETDFDVLISELKKESLERDDEEKKGYEVVGASGVYVVSGRNLYRIKYDS